MGPAQTPEEWAKELRRLGFGPGKEMNIQWSVQQDCNTWTDKSGRARLAVRVLAWLERIKAKLPKEE